MVGRHSLIKRDVQRIAFFWHMTGHMTYSYQRLQADCLAQIMGPIFERLYPNDHGKMIEGSEHHMLYFSTEPCWGTVLPGTVAALEESLVNDDSGEVDASIIAEIKTTLVEPLTDIDDTVWTGLTKSITLSVTLGWAMQGYVRGARAYGIGVTLLDFAITYFVFIRGYQLGMGSVDRFLESGFIKEITTFLGIIGLFCLGTMIVKHISIGAVLEVEMKIGTLNLGEIMDKIPPHFLPPVTTLFAYWLQVKGEKITTVLIALFVIGSISGVVGLLGQRFFKRDLTVLSYIVIIGRKLTICFSCIPAREEKASC